MTLKSGRAPLGGGLYATGYGLTMTNSLVYQNGVSSSTQGGGLYLDGGDTLLLNNTFQDNRTTDDGAAIYQAGGVLVLYNNLIAANISQDAVDSTSGAHAAVHGAGVTYEGDYNLWYANTVDVGGDVVKGSGALEGQDPLLTADLQLGSDSPARDQGDPGIGQVSTSGLDYWNQPRVMGMRIDIGAYEHPVETNFTLTPLYRYEIRSLGTLLVYTHTLQNNTGVEQGSGLTDTFTIDWSSTLGWITSTTPSVMTLGPGESGTITLTGRVPTEDSGGLLDVSIITVTTGLGTGAYVTAVDETRGAFDPGVEITPTWAFGMVEPGATITYPLTVQNLGNGWDSYTMTVTSGRGTLSPDVTPALAPLSTTLATLTMTPSVDAISGTVEVATVTVTSVFSAVVDDTSTVTTTVARVRGVQMTADESQMIGADAVVTYTHTLTNTGNYTESIVLDYISSAGWTGGEFVVDGAVVRPGDAVTVGPYRVKVVVFRLPVPLGNGGTEDAATITATVTGTAYADAVVDTTTVSPVYRFMLTPLAQTQIAEPDTVLVFTHTLTNTGNTDDNYTLAAPPAGSGWGAEVNTPVFLESGLVTTVLVTVTVPSSVSPGEMDTPLTVTSQGNPELSRTVTDTVDVRVDVESIIGLQAFNDSPTIEGATTTLSATTISDNVETWTWGFGDGQTDSGQVVQHTYPASGVYTAVVTASNAFSTVMATTVVTITEVPSDPIVGLQAFNDSPTIEGLTTTLSATVASGNVDTWAWGFGDGDTGTGQLTTHQYPASGVYTAVVTASNAVSTVTETTVVTITEGPTYYTYLPLIVRSFESREGPDLVVTNLTITPASPASGQSVTVRVTVRNQGSQPVPYGNNFYVDFYVNRAPQLVMVGDLSWGAQGAWFGAGETHVFEGVYVFAVAGSHQVYAQVDTDNTVLESLEANNQFGPQPITVTDSGTSNVDEVPLTPVSPRRPRPTPTPGMPDNP